MSTAARPSLAVRSFASAAWVPWAMFATDALAIEIAFALGLAVRWMLAPWLSADIGWDQFAGVAAGVLLLPLINYQIGLYPGYMLGPVERLRRRTLATFAIFGVLVAWDSIVARGVFSRGVLLAALVFALILPPLAESAVRAALVRRGRWGMAVVLLGAGETGRAIARTLQREPALGLHPVAFLDNRPETWNRSFENVPVIGPLGLAPDFERRADAAILCLGDIGNEDAAPLLQDLNFPRVIVIPNLSGAAGLWVTARDLSGFLNSGSAVAAAGSYLGFEIKKNLMIRRNLVLKLAMDRALALLLFLAAAPAIILSALWIKVSSRGPVFYRQLREGFQGRRIAVWKLRTMYADPGRLLEEWLASHPEDQAHWRSHFKLKRDPRVLPGIGMLLRRTSLDELPQLWSVLKGDMSLVGPRPLPDYHLEHLSTEFRGLRARVLPGMTGLWQVSTRSDGDLGALEAMDTFYIRNWSPWLDLYIVARTFAAVILARGAY